MIQQITAYLVPLLLCGISLCILCRKQDLFSSYLLGAKDGMRTCTHLLPSLCALTVGISMLRASGACDAIAALLAPLCEKIGIPTEILPLLAVRPFSGGASTALAQELFTTFGADSFPARCAAVLMGSSDTVFYVVAVYFGAVGIRHGKHTLAAALVTMLCAALFACAITRVCF